MSGDYEKEFVKKYGDLMYYKGALYFAKDSLSRALYAEQIIKIIESINIDDSLKQSYEKFTQREEVLSLNSLEKECRRETDNWREEDKK